MSIHNNRISESREFVNNNIKNYRLTKTSFKEALSSKRRYRAI